MDMEKVADESETPKKNRTYKCNKIKNYRSKRNTAPLRVFQFSGEI